MQVIISDLETYLEMFLCMCYDPQEDEWRRFEVSAWKNELDGLIKYVDEHEDHYFIYYNGIRFDSQVLEFIIRNHQLWLDKSRLEICAIIAQFAADVIHDANYNVFPQYRQEHLSFKLIDPFEIAHYSNKNRMVSLKRLEFEMDLDNIEETPVDFRKINLTRQDCVSVIGYCKNDCIALYKFYLVIIGETDHPLYKDNNQIQLRMDIEKEFGIKCLNFSDSKIGDEMIKKFYCEEKRILYSDLPRKGTFRKSIPVKSCIAPYVQFQTTQLKDFLSNLKKEIMKPKDEFKKKIKFYGNTYSFMRGGLHTENAPHVFKAHDDVLIIDWDVSSYYPAIIINNGKYPAHLGKEFLNGYKKMFDRRLELKPLAKHDKRIKGIVGALKLAVNSVYGKSSDMQNWVYDRLLTMFTTITGELSLMMLIEAYELAGIHVISANTDGVTIEIHTKDLIKMNEINAWWMEITKYELERTDYQKIVFSTVNDYIAIKVGYDKAKTNEKEEYIKKKGDFLTDFELHKNKSARVVPIALNNYFIHGTPIADSIHKHDNIYDFALRQKASKDFHYEGIIMTPENPSVEYINSQITEKWYTNNWWDNKKYWLEKDGQTQTDHWGGYTREEMIHNITVNWRRTRSKTSVYNKLIRYYVSNKGEKLLKIKNPECTTNAAKMSQVHAGEWLATVCNYLPKKTRVKDCDINYNYYIQKANLIVDKIAYQGRKHKVENLNQLKLF
jgi:hypothetical protein